MKTSLVCLALALLAALTDPLVNAASVAVTSPDGAVKAELSDAGGRLRYRVTVDGRQVLAPSNLGVLSDGVELGQGAILGEARHSTVNERYRFFGAHAEASNIARRATVPVVSQGESYAVDIHVANDGVGVRLRLPAKPGRKIEADRYHDGKFWVYFGTADEGYFMSTVFE